MDRPLAGLQTGRLRDRSNLMEGLESNFRPTAKLVSESEKIEAPPTPFSEFVAAVWEVSMDALDVFAFKFLHRGYEILVSGDKDEDIALISQGFIQHLGHYPRIYPFFLGSQHRRTALRADGYFMMRRACAFGALRLLLSLDEVNRHARHMGQNSVGPRIKLGLFGRIGVIGTGNEKALISYLATDNAGGFTHQNSRQLVPVGLETRLQSLMAGERKLIVPKIKETYGFKRDIPGLGSGCLHHRCPPNKRGSQSPSFINNYVGSPLSAKSGDQRRALIFNHSTGNPSNCQSLFERKQPSVQARPERSKPEWPDDPAPPNKRNT